VYAKLENTELKHNLLAHERADTNSVPDDNRLVHKTTASFATQFGPTLKVWSEVKALAFI